MTDIKLSKELHTRRCTEHRAFHRDHRTDCICERGDSDLTDALSAAIHYFSFEISKLRDHVERRDVLARWVRALSQAAQPKAERTITREYLLSTDAQFAEPKADAAEVVFGQEPEIAVLRELVASRAGYNINEYQAGLLRNVIAALSAPIENAEVVRALREDIEDADAHEEDDVTVPGRNCSAPSPRSRSHW